MCNIDVYVYTANTVVALQIFEIMNYLNSVHFVSSLCSRINKTKFYVSQPHINLKHYWTTQLLVSGARAACGFSNVTVAFFVLRLR